MTAPVAITRTNLDATALRGAAAQSDEADAVRRILALATCRRCRADRVFGLKNTIVSSDASGIRKADLRYRPL
jgi:hypothetical protein